MSMTVEHTGQSIFEAEMPQLASFMDTAVVEQSLLTEPCWQVECFASHAGPTGGRRPFLARPETVIAFFSDGLLETGKAEKETKPAAVALKGRTFMAWDALSTSLMTCLIK